MKIYCIIIVCFVLLFLVSCSVEYSNKNLIVVPVKAVKLIVDDFTKGSFKCEYLFENENQLYSETLTKKQIKLIKNAKIVFLFNMPKNKQTQTQLLPYNNKIKILTDYINQITIIPNDYYYWLDFEHYTDFARGIAMDLIKINPNYQNTYEKIISNIVDNYDVLKNNIKAEKGENVFSFSQKDAYFMNYLNNYIQNGMAVKSEKSSISLDPWCHEKYNSMLDYMDKQLAHLKRGNNG